MLEIESPPTPSVAESLLPSSSFPTSINLGQQRGEINLRPQWDEQWLMVVCLIGAALMFYSYSVYPLLSMFVLGSACAAIPLYRWLLLPTRALFADRGLALFYPLGRLKIVPYAAIQASEESTITVDGRRYVVWMRVNLETQASDSLAKALNVVSSIGSSPDGKRRYVMPFFLRWLVLGLLLAVVAALLGW
jgi:hypothetical protein